MAFSTIQYVPVSSVITWKRQDGNPLERVTKQHLAEEEISESGTTGGRIRNMRPSEIDSRKYGCVDRSSNLTTGVLKQDPFFLQDEIL